VRQHAETAEAGERAIVSAFDAAETSVVGGGCESTKPAIATPAPPRRAP
jgi:hypothetical protein